MRFAFWFCLITGALEYLLGFLVKEEPEKSVHKGAAYILIALSLIAEALIK